MKIKRLIIEHFRGVKSATLHFNGHTLLVGTNNVGKSTICEALDLVLGPDRLSKFPPVEEFDFYNAQYLEEDGETPIPIQIEVVLTCLTAEIERSCNTHIEFWHLTEKRILSEGEIDQANSPTVIPCLRIKTIAQYNREEDEFEATTVFCHGTNKLDNSEEKVQKSIKRLFGFLYLRALRTGNRALSLERGSLLDIILRMQGIRTGLWEQSIKRLRELDPPVAAEAFELAPVLENIEKRLGQYIPINAEDRATKLFVSQLTREHLRKTISFFLTISADQRPVPFQEVGTGTLNTLVLALLSFIAEVKKENVIFAMEEPELALPPHTQRRIASYLLNETTQCFVTSHSPYVIEQFSSEQIQILRRNGSAVVTAIPLSQGSALKDKTYKRYARRGLAEAMLGAGVIVVEGITEQSAIRSVAEKLEETDETLYPLDLSGISIFPVDGDGSLPMFGAFFKNLGLKAYAFYDFKKRKEEENQKIVESFDLPNEILYTGMEKLLAAEIPLDRQWQFLSELVQSGEQGNIGIPSVRPNDQEISLLLMKALKSNKGNSYAGRIISLCDVEEMPASIVNFLANVYKDFPRPRPIQYANVEFDEAVDVGASYENTEQSEEGE